MKKLNIDTKNIWNTTKALFTTAMWAGFIVVSFFTALTLRGDIDLAPVADGILGSLQGGFGLAALGIIVYTGQVNKNNKK